MRFPTFVHIINLVFQSVAWYLIFFVSVPGMRQVYDHNPGARRLLSFVAQGHLVVALVSLAALLARESTRFAPLVVLVLYHLANMLVFMGPGLHGVKFHEIADPRIALGAHSLLFALSLAAWIDAYDLARNYPHEKDL